MFDIIYLEKFETKENLRMESGEKKERSNRHYDYFIER